MTTLKLINLMMRCSDSNPYGSGKLTKNQNILFAIELAKLCKNFADAGQTDEAMDIESKQWVEVISKLKGNLISEKRNNKINIILNNDICERKDTIK